MVLGGTSHVVGHDVYEVHILDAALEVDELSRADGSSGEQQLLAQCLAQGCHEQREVLCIVGRR